MPPEPAPNPVRQRHDEMSWLAQNAHLYPGQWVALDGSRLVAHGPDLKTVSTAASNQGIERPLLTHLPEESDLPFGCW